MKPPVVILCIDGGRKDKVRPGDILGALTGDAGILGSQVGKIDIFDFSGRYRTAHCGQSAEPFVGGKIKGRNFKVRRFC